MVSPNILLQKLQPFENKNVILVQDQSVGDIIDGILVTHGKYAKQYDAILPYFEDDDIVETGKNVFEFLKKNCKYVIESDSEQTLRSPAAIIATGKTKGCDCKSYSLFIGGILSAYKRKHNVYDKLFYRFAGYNGNDLQHVFVVINDNGTEYWVDPVLNYFNDRSKLPTKTKNINMALISMAGIGNNITQQIQDWQSIGKHNYGLAGGIGEDGSQSADQTQSGDEQQFSAQDVETVLSALNNLFGAKRGEADTEYARNLYLQMYPDVAADPGFARNPWKHYQENGWREGRYWFDNPSVTKETIDDYRRRYPDVARTWDNSILQHYLQFGKSEGRTIKLKITGSGGGAGTGTGTGTGSGGGAGTGTGTGTGSGKQTGMSIWLILALIGAGAAIFLNKKK